MINLECTYDYFGSMNSFLHLRTNETTGDIDLLTDYTECIASVNPSWYELQHTVDKLLGDDKKRNKQLMNVYVLRSLTRKSAKIVRMKTSVLCENSLKCFKLNLKLWQKMVCLNSL